MKRTGLFVVHLINPESFVPAYKEFMKGFFQWDVEEYGLDFEVVFVDGSDYRIDYLINKNVASTRRVQLIETTRGFVEGWNKALKMHESK